jgi:hypothetical protein
MILFSFFYCPGMSWKHQASPEENKQSLYIKQVELFIYNHASTNDEHSNSPAIPMKWQKILQGDTICLGRVSSALFAPQASRAARCVQLMNIIQRSSGRVYPDAFPVYPKDVKRECIPEMSVSRMHSRKSECIPDTQKTYKVGNPKSRKGQKKAGVLTQKSWKIFFPEFSTLKTNL